MFPLTIPRVLHVMPRAEKVIAAWMGPLEQAMAAWSITSPPRVAAFLAQVAHESAELTQLEENLRYSAQGLRKVFPKYFPNDELAAAYAKAGPEAIASRVYSDRLGNRNEASGDGWLYRGRGPLGVTFRSNYSACSIEIAGDADTLLLNPEFLSDPEFGAAAAGWYWGLHEINELADKGDFDGVCDAVNLGRKTIALGDSNGYADRVSYWKRAIEATA